MLIGFHRMAASKAEDLIDLISDMNDPLYEAFTIGLPESEVIYFQIVAPEMELRVTNEFIYIKMENDTTICELQVDRDQYERIEIIN